MKKVKTIRMTVSFAPEEFTLQHVMKHLNLKENLKSRDGLASSSGGHRIKEGDEEEQGTVPVAICIKYSSLQQIFRL